MTDNNGWTWTGHQDPKESGILTYIWKIVS